MARSAALVSGSIVDRSIAIVPGFTFDARLWPPVITSFIAASSARQYIKKSAFLRISDGSFAVLAPAF